MELHVDVLAAISQQPCRRVEENSNLRALSRNRTFVGPTPHNETQQKPGKQTEIEAAQGLQRIPALVFDLHFLTDLTRPMESIHERHTSRKLEASEIRHHAVGAGSRDPSSTRPSKPSKLSKVQGSKGAGSLRRLRSLRGRERRDLRSSKPPSLKPTFSPNERRKATRERFWGLKTKKKR